ncbi:hypothetical protein ACFWP7_41270 [Streptomyces sp. NPDC058470]|uniref:hypothetical protein n=1 Tax=Streptomyces sp. NPDC058470 TaxID=3346515 RepID=UPI003652287F
MPTGCTTTTYDPSKAGTATGRGRTAPVARMATGGWLMIGAVRRAPYGPGLLIVKCPFPLTTVPVRLAGMASATTSQLRDLGFTLGPALIGAIALSRAASEFGNSLATSPLPEGVKAAAGQVAAAGGPLAVNSLPPQSPPGGAVPLALDALGHGYSVGFVVCACAALVSCLLAGLVLRGGRPKVNIAESEIEDTSPEPAAA